MATLLDVLNSKNSSRRFSLVVSGGGMRGVYSAGALACLDSYRLQDNFISVTGSSCGALNGAYFLAHQPGSVNVYTSLLANKTFVNLARPRKKVDIDYMVDVALHQHFPIDVEKLKKTKAKFDIILTDAGTGKKVSLDQHQGFNKIYEEFRATSALPVLYDKKVAVLDKYYIDGGVSDLIPVDVAAEHDPTDIIVIMPRPLSFYTRKSLFKPTIKKLVRQAAKYQSVAVRDQLPTNEKILRSNIESIRQGHLGEITIHLIAPKEEIGVGIASIDSSKLEAAGEAGWRDCEALLSTELVTQETLPIDEPEETVAEIDKPEPEEREPVISEDESRYLEEVPLEKPKKS